MNANFEEKNSKLITNDLKGQVDFINKLEQDYIKFIKNWTYEYKKYYEVFKNNVNNRPSIIRLRKSILNIEKIYKHNFKDNKKTSLIHVNIVPEKVVTKSPLTILNAQWGVGKTHFLTDLLISIKREKIKPKIIKKYIYIDSWKYLSSNNLVNDFIVELGKNLALDSGIKWFNSKKMIKNIFNYVVVPNINKRFGLSIPKFDYDNSISTINRNITSPTLIIIDNVERLGPTAWEIIRVIQKLSISTNLIFLLSINKDKFNELCGLNDNEYEWNLQKYISIPYYNLKPNYKDLIDSYNIPKKYNEQINKILTSQSSDRFLSVREAEKILQLCNFNKEEIIDIPNEYYLLSKFRGVWNPLINEKINGNNVLKSVIEEIILNDIKNFHNNYIFKLLDINNKYVDYITEIAVENDGYYNEIDISFIKKINFHSIVNVDPEYRFFNINFEKYIEKLIYYLTLSKKYINNYYKIDEDIFIIRKIIYEIKNDVDLQKINEASYLVYEKYKNHVFSFEERITYDKYYLNNIIEILYLYE